LPYYKALRDCDRFTDQERGHIDLSSLEAYVDELLTKQLSS
jgi:hypothetical protein